MCVHLNALTHACIHACMYVAINSSFSLAVYDFLSNFVLTSLSLFSERYNAHTIVKHHTE